MNKAVKFSTIINNVAIAVIILSAVCYAKNLKRAAYSVFRLDMATDSVDDQFKDCHKETYTMIKDKILPQELSSNPMFATAWERFTSVNDDFKRIIKVYTSNIIYAAFNGAVGSGRNSYISSFPYKTFHFFLTRAVQIYRVKKCVNVFRSTRVSFDTNVLGHEMRFGRFASTSLSNRMLGLFGTTSCFKIRTCFGADISSLSEMPSEKEVLIPPFEKFKITKIARKRMSCGVLYTLQSIGVTSSMNCELLKETEI